MSSLPPTRTERDSMGEVRVPADALYGAQTQRAIDNFQISGLTFGRSFVRALGLIKLAAVGVNADLDLLAPEVAEAIAAATREVIDGVHDAQFAIDVFQTGSGTSTNMNANEVIANRANQILGQPLGAKAPVHPNDHVNMGQSSNDVIPTTINVAAYLGIAEALIPALDALADTIQARADEHADVVTTGRTHLMDAMPITMQQEMGAWASQVRGARRRLAAALPDLAELAIGGTAVGTGINTPKGFGKAMAARLAALTGYPFVEAGDHFAAQASSDVAVAASGALAGVAVALMKVSNDLRWMNSGPLGGLGELALPALQPGSSIMPGKVNPVIPEATMMVAAQVLGNDHTISVAASHANFQLSVMLPVIAHDLLESIDLLSRAARALESKAVRGLVVNRERIAALVSRNPILVTTLNPVIGYDRAAAIAKRAYAEGRPLADVAREMTDLTDEALAQLLDPRRMTGTQHEGDDPA